MYTEGTVRYPTCANRLHAFKAGEYLLILLFSSLIRSLTLSHTNALTSFMSLVSSPKLTVMYKQY